MGRNRTFEEPAVVALAARQFLATGYEATSLDDLVLATGLHRGSLYQAFGSKRGLFLAALRQVAGTGEQPGELAQDALDLLLVALLELAPVDDEVRDVTHRLLRRAPSADVPALLGERLVARARIDLSDPPDPTTRSPEGTP